MERFLYLKHYYAQLIVIEVKCPYIFFNHFYLQSSSTIVTVGLKGWTRRTPSGNDLLMITSLKFSLPSTITSSVIGTSNVTLVAPAGKRTLNIPGP